MLAFTSKFNSPDVQALWTTYLNTPKSGTKGVLPARRLFADPASRLVSEFRIDAESQRERNRVLALIASRARAQGLVPAEGTMSAPIPFSAVLSSSELLDLPMSFKDPFNRIPGLLAGGFGKNQSDAGDDVRNMDGQFVITNFDGQSVVVDAAFVFDVQDAIDFCPGAPGSGFAQFAVTDDLSRLEATPDVPTYDTPFEVVWSDVGTAEVK